MIDWNQWQILLAVSRSGTYAQAAKSLNIDATTIGRRLKHLERAVGYQFFTRQDGRLYPTHQCETLLTHVETASEALRAAEQQGASIESGSLWRNLRLTAPPFLVSHLFAPAIADLTHNHRIRVELLGTGVNVSLSRREADIAIRIDDRSPSLMIESEHVKSETIGRIAYAVYCKSNCHTNTLPWAGIIEDYVRTSGGKMMIELAGKTGFQFSARHFVSLVEITASGAARSMLPRCIADSDDRLMRTSDTILEQPLWMLTHRQDQKILYFKHARSWIRSIANTKLSEE